MLYSEVLYIDLILNHPVRNIMALSTLLQLGKMREKKLQEFVEGHSAI